MSVHNWDSIEVEQMNPHLTRQVIHAENITVARLELKAGGFVPEHSHVNEQIAMIQSGRLKFLIAGKEGNRRQGRIGSAPAQCSSLR